MLASYIYHLVSNLCKVQVFPSTNYYTVVPFLCSNNMSEKLDNNNSPLSAPLLSEWKHHALGDAIDDEEKIIRASHPPIKSTASFFRTCLNGLNAISGLTLFPQHTYIIYMLYNFF